MASPADVLLAPLAFWCYDHFLFQITTETFKNGLIVKYYVNESMYNTRNTAFHHDTLKVAAGTCTDSSLNLWVFAGLIDE